MGKEQQTATWVFIMLTAVRKRFGLSRSDFTPIAKKYGIIHFLIDQYELLHYYDNDYIVDDVVRYIEEQGGDCRELSNFSEAYVFKKQNTGPSREKASACRGLRLDSVADIRLQPKCA
jgi:hypothetical protein